MVSKICLTIYVLSIFVSSVLSQCIGREAIGASLPGAFGGPWSYDALSPFDMPHGAAWPSVGCGTGPLGSTAGFVPAAGYGGGLSVTSASPIAPTGLTITSENTIEGVVAVTGQLPFLGAVAADGIFSTVGAGDVWYGCGDGAVGIVAEVPFAPAAVAPGYGYGGALGVGVGYNGFNGPIGYNGCGYGALY